MKLLLGLLTILIISPHVFSQHFETASNYSYYVNNTSGVNYVFEICGVGGCKNQMLEILPYKASSYKNLYDGYAEINGDIYYRGVQVAGSDIPLELKRKIDHTYGDDYVEIDTNPKTPIDYYGLWGSFGVLFIIILLTIYKKTSKS